MKPNVPETKKPASLIGRGVLDYSGTASDLLGWSVGGEEEDRTPDLRIANTNKSIFIEPDWH
jgi:hypothetical protein